MNYWIVIKGKFNCVNTIACTRKDSIKAFEKNWCSWEEGKENGYKVVKCELKIIEK